MKKIISFILICSIMLAFLTGCSYFDKKDENKDGDVINGGGGTDESSKGIPLDKESDPIKSLIELLSREAGDGDPVGGGLPYAIYSVQYNDTQPLEVAFNPLDYYFVCGFYNEDPNEILWKYRLAEKCNWYRFDSVEDIPEYINGEKCVLAYQFNRASSVINLLGNENVPEMEHVSILDIKFENGFNTTPPITFAETIIYLQGYFVDDLNKSTIYYTTRSMYHYYITIRFVELDGVKYATIPSKQVKHNPPNQGEYKHSLEVELDIYYDALIDVVEIDKYSIYIEYSTYYFSCIKIDDVVKVMKEEVQK